MKPKFFNVVSDGNEASILLYGEIGEGNVSSGDVVRELLTLSTQFEAIKIRINSNGGDVFSGMAIYNALRQSTAKITIYVDGVAASIAGVIALCGKPLYMSPYAKLMLHAVSGGMHGSISEMRQTADMMEELQSNLAQMVAGRLGLSPEEVLTRYFDEADHWISAQEAEAMGLINGIYQMDDESEALKKPLTKEEVYNYFNNKYKVGSKPKEQGKGKEQSFAMSVATELFNALEAGYITEEEKAFLELFSKENSKSVIDALKRKKEAFEASFEAEFEAFCKTGFAMRNINNFNALKPLLKKMAKRNFQDFKALFGKFKPKEMANDWIVTNKKPSEDRSEWTLNDWRRYAPKELMRDPDLYERLLKEEQERTPKQEKQIDIARAMAKTKKREWRT